MNWIDCDVCGRLVNSDDDPECFQQYADSSEVVVCEVCREGTEITEIKEVHYAR